MASIDSQYGGTPSPVKTQIHYDEPETKSPPALSVGPLAWVRENLFSSFLDAIITVALTIGVIAVIIGLINWIVGEANWFVINNNLRLFLRGFYPDEHVWRLWVLFGVIAFLTGYSFASWSRIAPTTALVIVAFVIVTFIAPRLISSAIEAPPQYLAAGDIEIVSGSITERPQERVAFIADSGSDIRITLASDITATDETLADPAGFADRASAATFNAAANRLATQDRIAEIELELREGLLTEAQRETLAAELGMLEVPPTVLESLHINQSPVNLTILDGQTLEPLASSVLASPDDEFVFNVPIDGWYVLEKSVDGEGLGLLRAININPLIERTISRDDPEGGGSVSVNQYERMLDKFVVEQERPRIEGSNVPFLIITDNQYRGTRPFTSWLRMFVGPGLDLIDMGVLVFVVFGAIGYGASIVINQNFPRPHPTNRRYAAQVWGLRLWGLFPFIMLILLLGTGTRLWGGLLLTFFLTVFGIAISFPIGVLAALGRRSHLPIVKIVSVLYIEIVRGVPLITVLFLANLMVPLIHPSLATVPGVLRVTVGIILFTGAYLAENVRGGLQAIPPGQEEAAKAVGLNNFQVTWYITLPQALRAVIPALVGMFISLYKDTSLVVIVGLIDLTGAANSVIAQTEFIGLRREAFLFISVIYFVFSYIMSIVSRRIEASGAGAATQRL